MTDAAILAPIFEKRLSLDKKGYEDISLRLWERMAASLDEIAANTRSAISARIVTAYPARKENSGAGVGRLHDTRRREGCSLSVQPAGETEQHIDRRSPSDGRTAVARTVRGGTRSPAPRGETSSPRVDPGRASADTPTKSELASAAGREALAYQRQGSVIAAAVSGSLDRLGNLGKIGADAVREDSDAKDAAGYALAGPLYGVVRELREAVPDKLKEKLEGTRPQKEKPETLHQAFAEVRERDDKGRFISNRDTARREIAQLELAEDELELQGREARAEDKRHKELLRAISSAGKGGLFERFSGGGRALSPRRRRNRDDIGIEPDIGGRRGGRASVGRRAGGRGLLSLGTRGARGLVRAVPLFAAGMAAYDGFQGWNDTAMQRRAFGLAEGQEATTGQKVSTAVAAALDMGGLGTGLLGLLGFDVDTAAIARGIYNAGTAIASVGQDFAVAFAEKTSAIWGGLSDFGSRIWTGAQEVCGALATLAGSALEQGMNLLAGVWDGARSAVSGIWTSLENFAQESIAAAGELLSGLWKSASALPEKIVAGAKNIASGALEQGGRLLAAGRETVGAGIAWAGEKAGGAWEGVKNIAASGWDKLKGLGSGLLDALGPSEVHAAELASVPVTQVPSADFAAMTVPAVEIPLAERNLLAAGAESQEEMVEAMSSVDEAMQEQNKLLSSIDSALATPDTYGIAGALGGVRDAIRDVRTGGNGGYVRTGASDSNPGYAYNPDSKIGDTIAHEESGTAGVRAIGYDRTGGTSYGKWQLSSRRGSLEEWLQLLESKGGEAAAVAGRLRAAGPTNTGGRSGAFVDAYLQEASANSELFENTQRESLLKHNYNPAMSSLQSDSLRRMIRGDKSLQEMMFSTAVQHGGGGAARIFNSVYRDGMSREELIRAVYAKRGGQFGSSTAQVQQSVQNRMDRERDLILGMNRGEASARRLRDSMAQGGTEAVQAGVSSMIAEATEDAKRRNVKYKMGGKDSATGEIDCSGWVLEMSDQLMAGMNAAMGQEVFSAEARRALSRGAGKEGAAGIVRAVSEQTGRLFSNEQLSPELAKEGMVIGLDTGSRGWEAGRFKDIDHVVQTYRDPATGELMVSESRGGRGVMSSRYADWYADQQRRGTKLYGADLVAMADAGKIKPSGVAPVADNASPLAIPAETQPVVIAEPSPATALQTPPVVQAETAMGAVPPSPASLGSSTQALHGPGKPESVRTILPAQALSGGGAGGDDRALLAILGKILAAIESGNRKAGTSDNGGGEPPYISMDYDDAAAQGMARDSA